MTQDHHHNCKLNDLKKCLLRYVNFIESPSFQTAVLRYIQSQNVQVRIIEFHPSSSNLDSQSILESPTSSVKIKVHFDANESAEKDISFKTAVKEVSTVDDQNPRSSSTQTQTQDLNKLECKMKDSGQKSKCGCVCSTESCSNSSDLKSSSNNADSKTIYENENNLKNTNPIPKSTVDQSSSTKSNSFVEDDSKITDESNLKSTSLKSTSDQSSSTELTSFDVRSPVFKNVTPQPSVLRDSEVEKRSVKLSAVQEKSLENQPKSSSEQFTPTKSSNSTQIMSQFRVPDEKENLSESETLKNPKPNTKCNCIMNKIMETSMKQTSDVNECLKRFKQFLDIEEKYISRKKCNEKVMEMDELVKKLSDILQESKEQVQLSGAIKKAQLEKFQHSGVPRLGHFAPSAASSRRQSEVNLHAKVRSSPRDLNQIVEIDSIGVRNEKKSESRKQSNFEVAKSKIGAPVDSQDFVSLQSRDESLSEEPQLSDQKWCPTAESGTEMSEEEIPMPHRVWQSSESKNSKRNSSLNKSFQQDELKCRSKSTKQASFPQLVEFSTTEGSNCPTRKRSRIEVEMDVHRSLHPSDYRDISHIPQEKESPGIHIIEPSDGNEKTLEPRKELCPVEDECTSRYLKVPDKVNIQRNWQTSNTQPQLRSSISPSSVSRRRQSASHEGSLQRQISALFHILDHSDCPTYSRPSFGRRPKKISSQITSSPPPLPPPVDPRLFETLDSPPYQKKRSKSPPPLPPLDYLHESAKSVESMPPICKPCQTLGNLAKNYTKHIARPELSERKSDFKPGMEPNTVDYFRGQAPARQIKMFYGYPGVLEKSQKLVQDLDNTSYETLPFAKPSNKFPSTIKRADQNQLDETAFSTDQSNSSNGETKSYITSKVSLKSRLPVLKRKRTILSEPTGNEPSKQKNNSKEKNKNEVKGMKRFCRSEFLNLNYHRRCFMSTQENQKAKEQPAPRNFDSGIGKSITTEHKSKVLKKKWASV